MQLFSRVRHFVTLCTIACQAPLSIGFSRQEYWSALPCPSSVDLPDSGIEPRTPALQAESLLSEPPGKPHIQVYSSLLNSQLLRWICGRDSLNKHWEEGRCKPASFHYIPVFCTNHIGHFLLSGKSPTTFFLISSCWGLFPRSSY